MYVLSSRIRTTPSKQRHGIIHRCWSVPGSVVAVLLLSGCAESPSALDPRGPAAQRIAELGWLMIVIASVVSLVVTLLLLYALFRSRRSNHTPRIFRGHALVVGGGIVFPIMVLVVLLLLTIDLMRTLSVTDPGRAAPLQIEVLGQQFWWEVVYPEQGFETANEIRIPVGEPVELRLTSTDVIHSLWIPQLHGKIDMIPGRVTSIVIQADQPGVYYGECAEFCGLQHAKMAFMVVAEPAEQFAVWLAEQREPAPDPTEPLVQQGKQIFLSSGCIQCHTIKGTHATGDLGPDLTHLASRLTLAAGTLQNNQGNLGGWIANPQTIKPGSMMPPTALTGEQLLALLAYLATLE